MTITIELPEETFARLVAEENLQERPAATIAAEAIVERYSDADQFPLDEASIQGIRQGLADAAAGRTYSIDEASARADAALIALQRSTCGMNAPEESSTDDASNIPALAQRQNESISIKYQQQSHHAFERKRSSLSVVR